MGSNCVPLLADVSLCPYEADFIEGNRKFGGMDSVSALSGVDCRFDPQSYQPKNYAIGICCFSSKLAALRRKRKNFSELALKESNEHVVNVHGGPRHHLIEI
jgi:hypothetical protein